MDDLIATKLLKMDEISQSSVDSGAGFLPMFGPAYIPFYGSHREYSDVYDKYSDLNHGVVSSTFNTSSSVKTCKVEFNINDLRGNIIHTYHVSHRK